MDSDAMLMQQLMLQERQREIIERREEDLSEIQRNEIRREQGLYIITVPSGISPLHDRKYSIPVQDGIIMNPYVPILSAPYGGE